MVNLLDIQLDAAEIAMVVFALVLLLVLVPFTIIDSIPSPRLSATQRLAWIVFIVIAPYLGAICYLLWGRKQKMT